MAGNEKIDLTKASSDQTKAAMAFANSNMAKAKASAKTQSEHIDDARDVAKARCMALASQLPAKKRKKAVVFVARVKVVQRASAPWHYYWHL